MSAGKFRMSAPPASRAPSILVIAGVTGAGKTQTALALARRWGAELVGADSVQVVRGFDIGSAKPTRAELDGVAHHLIDVIDPDETMDAADFAARADTAITDIHRRGRHAIVVGGTGLWIRALVRGLVPLPTPDPVLRASLMADVEQLGPILMHDKLRSVDPYAADRIHHNDTRRIVRALEVYQQTGTPLGSLQERHAKGAPRYRTCAWFLDRTPREALHDAYRKRVRAMLDAGWVDEVRELLRAWGPSARALTSVGYRQLVDHLQGGPDLVETERLIYKAMRTYARRQRTWFRSDPLEVRHAQAAELLGDSAIAEMEAWLGAPPEPSATPR